MTDSSVKKVDTSLKNDGNSDKLFKLTGGLFLAGVTSMSLLLGFSTTLALTKKKDSANFLKGFSGNREMVESGSSLALRALGRGTLYAVTGVSLFTFCIWKIVGAKDMKEFRAKVQSVTPNLPRKTEPQGRTEFETVREFVTYLIDEDERKKCEKKG
ncbi:transmembrane protein 242-like [Tubulanus polymorphus]|uniref:transmembrane protein 242-like n=1 Tax=Tubulanus polymorphus TaxID=672921 RepID=UPI003DA3E744